MAMSVKDLAKWLKEEVEFLKENQDYSGGWIQLGNGLAAVVCWEEGWGDEKRDDCIQATDNPDYALVAGIKIYNPQDTPDFWLMLSDKDGNIVTETSGIAPNTDYEAEAKWLLDDFARVENVDYDEDGVIISEVEEPKKEEALKESKGDYLDSKYKKIIGEYFDYTGDFEFLDIVADVISRVDDFGNDDDIWYAIDNALIYIADQWTIAQFYTSSPADLVWDDVFSSFEGDIYAICNKIVEAGDEE